MMITLKRIKNYIKRLKGKSQREIAETLGKTGAFYNYRICNLYREQKYIAWLPHEKELFGLLYRDTRIGFRGIENYIPTWEERLRKVFLPINKSKKINKIFEQYFHKEKKMIINASIDISKGRLTLFRSLKMDIGSDINWHSTLINEKSWPIKYFRKIDLRESSHIGDLRTTWELNRHLHWVTLGKAYFLTEQISHFLLFWKEFESWTKNNPYLLGINWLSAMEVAIRLNHWLSAYTLFCNCPAFEIRAKIEFWSWVYLHIHYLKYHLTSEDRGFHNNHSILEAASLYISGLILSEFKDSPKWRQKGKRVLSEELERQFLSDGFHEELCSSYHLQVTEAYLFAAIIADRCDCEIPKEWKHSILKMMKALWNIAKPDGSLPMLGDGDDGTFLCLDSNRNSLSVKTASDIFSMWLNNRDIKLFDSRLSEGAFWFSFLKTESVNHMYYPVNNNSENAVLKSAQFAIFKQNNKNGINYALFSVGIQNPSRNNNHRHADLLSLNLTIGGNDIFVDPGTYCYNGPLKWRRYFQSTSSHNTVTINGQNQFEFTNGHFGIDKIDYTSSLKIWNYNGIDIFRGEYSDVSREAWHCRYIFLILPYFVIIHDSCGEGDYSEAILNFTLSPAVKLISKSDHIICAVANELIQTDLYAGKHTFRENGNTEQKWLSPSYWIKDKCNSIQMYSRRSRNYFTTVLKASEEGSYERSFFDDDSGMKEILLLEIPDKILRIDFLDKISTGSRRSSSLIMTCHIHMDDSTRQEIKFDIKAGNFTSSYG